MTPRCTVITTVSDPDRHRLWSCLDSVRRQTLADWEHVIVDATSHPSSVTRLLNALTRNDERVRVVRHARREGRDALLTEGLASATGEFVTFLAEHDVLESDALEVMVDAVAEDVDVAYSDHDFIAPDGLYVAPVFKPDFSPEFLRGQNYIAGVVLARRQLVDDVGGFRAGFDGAEHHDLLLRLGERARRVAHVPRVLYHIRSEPTTAAGAPEGPDSFASARRAVADHCRRLGIVATVEPTDHEGCFRVVRRLTEQPTVSVVIPTRGTRGVVWGRERCFVVEAVRSLIDRSTYPALEVVIVYDTATPAEVLDELESLNERPPRLVPFDEPFNFSAKINLGVVESTGPLLLLLNDDVEIIDASAIEELVAHLQGPDVAMAGAKLLFADGTLQHGGHVYTGLPEHACFGWRGDSPGPAPLRPLAVARECSGVTAGCALVRRSAFEEVGGFATELPLNYNDADFSLKLRGAGYRIIWTPFSTWYHFESQSRGRHVPGDDEIAWMRARWAREIRHDPYYNPNLAPGRNDFLESPRARRPLEREP